MATKYEIVASLVKREHDQLEWEAGGHYIDDGNHLVIINVLRIMHEYKDHGPGPNSDWDWEDIVDEMFDAIARGFATIDFDAEVFGGADEGPPTATESPSPNEQHFEDPATIGSTPLVELDESMPPVLDIPNQH